MDFDLKSYLKDDTSVVTKVDQAADFSQ